MHAIQQNIASTMILLGPSLKSLKVMTVLGLSARTLNRCHHRSGQISGKVMFSHKELHLSTPHVIVCAN